MKVVPPAIAQRAVQLTAALDCRPEANSTLSNCPDAPYVCGATCSTSLLNVATKMEFDRTVENVTMSPFLLSGQVSNVSRGALFMRHSRVTLLFSKLENNVNTASGSAGIYACERSTLAVHHVDFFQNQVQSPQGLANGSSSISCHSSTAEVTNSRYHCQRWPVSSLSMVSETF